MGYNLCEYVSYYAETIGLNMGFDLKAIHEIHF